MPVKDGVFTLGTTYEDVQVRFLPAVSENLPYFVFRYHHQSGWKNPSVCHKDFVNGKWEGKCLICHHYNEFWKDGPPRFYRGDKDKNKFQNAIRTLKPLERFFWNIVIRGEESAGTLQWASGSFIQKTVLVGMLGSESFHPLGDVTDLKSGYDLIIRRHPDRMGEMQYPNYSSSGFASAPSPLGTEEQIHKWMSQRKHFVKCSKEDVRLYEHFADIKVLVMKTDEEMLADLESVYGYLGPSRNKKTIYRYVDEPFEPQW